MHAVSNSPTWDWPVFLSFFSHVGLWGILGQDRCDGGGGGTHQVAERKSKQTKEAKELT